jgi:NAD(P)-dependent dehydrogenase (short-subunit alcohol dehydrogenase family)
MRLNDQTVLVTGSTGGIGKAISERCVGEGANVVIHGLDRAAGQRVVDELGEERAALCIADLAEPGAAQRLVDFTIERFGWLDALVNNAAIIESANIHTADAAFLERILAVNTMAPFLLIQAALPHLKKSGGCVLNIGSINAYCGEPNLLPYSMAKGALTTMTRNLGDTLMREDGVRVNQINPGWVLTEREEEIQRGHGAEPGWETRLPKDQAPAGRILRPAEIAAFAVTWLSPEIGPVSGQVVELEQFPMIGRNPPKEH